MAVADDYSEEGEDLFHEVGKAIVQQTEALVSICVEAVQSTFQAVKGSAKNWATFAHVLLRNITADVNEALGMFYLDILLFFLDILLFCLDTLL